MTVTIRLPNIEGHLEDYRMVGKPVRPAASRPRTREIYAAAHVVADPLRSSSREPVIDWDATLHFRHHLWSLGLGVAEAMDTAQRGQGLPAGQVSELVRRTAAEAASVGGAAVFGVATDQLPDQVGALNAVVDAYLAQLAMVEGAGGRAVLMASRQLAALASHPDDYLKVYDSVLASVGRPVVLHWLGEQFDPALRGYWGSTSFPAAAQTVLELIRSRQDRVYGIKLSVLSAEAEQWLRGQLPAGVHMFTGDDYNYVELIRGTDGVGSDALLGAFDPLASVASAAFARLDANDSDGFTELLQPTIPLARHVFGAPTYDYKCGVVFLAYLNGHQDAFRMLRGMESARSVLHLAETFRLADQCGALIDPDQAAARMSAFLASAGVVQR